MTPPLTLPPSRVSRGGVGLGLCDGLGAGFVAGGGGRLEVMKSSCQKERVKNSERRRLGYRPRGTIPVSKYCSYLVQWRDTSVRVVYVFRVEFASCHSEHDRPSFVPVASAARCWRSCCRRNASCSACTWRARCDAFSAALG